MAKKPKKIYVSSHKIIQKVLKHPNTHRISTEQAQDSRFDELFHSIYDAVMLTDLEGNIFEVNVRAEQSFMRNDEELSGQNIVDLISGADEELLKIVRENVGDGKYIFLEAVCVRGDESRFNAEIVVNMLRHREEGTLCFFIRDITVRKQAEEELEKVNEKLVDAEKVQARLDTLSTLLYEFNNPLQILTCLAEQDKNKEYKKQLDRIVAVLDQLHKQESLEAIVDEEGGTRYDLPVEKELVDCDFERLLVVDDEEVLTQMFVHALSSSFPDVVIDSAGDGRQALDLFIEKHHAFIVMDVAMPNMTGEEAFAEIKAVCDREGLKLPSFIFCTGFDVNESLREIVGDGSSHSCLRKPMSITELVEAVKRRLPQQAGL